MSELKVEQVALFFKMISARRRSDGRVCVMAQPTKANKKLADEMRDRGEEPPRSCRTTQQFFGLEDGSSLLRFVGAHNGIRGLHVRQARFRPDAASADVENVIEVTHLWIDVDAKNYATHYSCEPEEATIIARQRLLQCQFPPSVLVRSGGGVHAYWLLTESVQGPDIEVAEEALRQLQRIFSGDKQRINSSLRLPGTINNNYNPPRYCEFDSWPITEVKAHDLEALRSWAVTQPELFGANDAVPADRRDAASHFMEAARQLGASMQRKRTDAEWNEIIGKLGVDGFRTQSVLSLAGYMTHNGVPAAKQIEWLVDKGCTLPVHKIRNIVVSIASRHNDRSPDKPVSMEGLE